MRTDRPPFTGAYWVVPGELMAGPYPSDFSREVAAAKLEALLDRGIRSFLSLMEEDPRGLRLYASIARELGARRGVRCEFLRFAIEDCAAPSEALMDDIVRAIDASVGQGRPVYAHCWGGRGRAGIVAGVYLIRSGRATPADVLDVIGALRGRDPRTYPSPETREQIEFVRRYRP